ncbi:MAG: glutamate-5-semialdehyde dehydrogenase [Solirubrobacterales bacterium]
MAVQARTVADACAQAKEASRVLATLDAATKDGALRAVAHELESRVDEIVEANAGDLEDGRAAGLSDALLDRLALNEERVRAMAAGVRMIVELPDPIGEELESRTLYNGLELRKVRVPLGVVAIVYEARPNVTVDAAALAIKSGNAVMLRGSSTAARSNAVLARIVADTVEAAGLPAGSVALIGGGDRSDLADLARQDRYVDLIIPRGGEGLKQSLKDTATVPVIYAAAGNCHVYVDAGADVAMAQRIAYNAKVQRPGVCNAAETLLVHSDIAAEVLPGLMEKLREAGVELRVDARTRALAAREGDGVVDATDEDWDTEYLGLTMAMRVVDSLEEAIDHVNRHGTGHSEAIVTANDAAAEAFTAGVDAACVYVNASTRFTDGGEFGMGAEMGNSTQKLHARGPIALRELTTSKYVVHGTGQVRE